MLNAYLGVGQWIANLGDSIWGEICAAAVWTVPGWVLLGEWITSDGASLLVAIISLFIAVLAFRHDKQTASLSGVKIIASGRFGETRTKPGSKAETETDTIWKVDIRPTGPGVRYAARAGVWEATNPGQWKISSVEQDAWRVGDDPHVVEGVRIASEPWADVYVGVVWESPRLFFSGFKTQGLRMKIPTSGEEIESTPYQVWEARDKEWKPSKKRLETVDVHPLTDATSFSKRHQP